MRDEVLDELWAVKDKISEEIGYGYANLDALLEKIRMVDCSAIEVDRSKKGAVPAPRLTPVCSS